MITIYEMRLDQVRRHFAQELDAMDADRADAIASAVASTAGPDSYDIQHRILERSPDEIATSWATIIAALFD